MVTWVGWLAAAAGDEPRFGVALGWVAMLAGGVIFAAVWTSMRRKRQWEGAYGVRVCSACGASLPHQARFCGACGKALSK